MKKTIPKKVTGLQYFAPTKEFWWDHSTDAVMYKIEMAPYEESMESNKWDEVVITPVSKIEFNTPIGEWIFRVCAMNENGFGLPSEPIQVYIGNHFA